MMRTPGSEHSTVVDAWASGGRQCHGDDRATFSPFPLGCPQCLQVQLKVNKLSSTKTQIPYEYYDIPFCRPPKRKEEMENLGEVLAGDAISNSPYQVRRTAGRQGMIDKQNGGEVLDVVLAERDTSRAGGGAGKSGVDGEPA